MKRWSLLSLSLAAVAATAPEARAQSNAISGLDVSMGILGGLQVYGHGGTYPTGYTAMAMSTTSCNLGIVDVPWQQPMQSNHPTIAFMAVRELNGRFEQISDRSFVKHGFYALSNNQCTPCQHPSNGTFLGVGCSDTYGTGNNSDRYYLGPPAEIDPWLGMWTPACSYFDAGDPAVGGAAACDGNRSLTNAMVSAMPFQKNRVVMQDADLGLAGATYYYQGQYVVRAEPEANRSNNLASCKMNVSWTGSSWSITQTGSQLQGTVLQRWTGSTLSSNTNALDDGRVYVAVKVTGPTAGQFHYEYAFHNRDNLRGVGAIRIPAATAATITNIGFSDIDALVGNDWTVTRTANELSFTTPDNPLVWNTIYNVWFDTDTAPTTEDLTLDAFAAGGGANSFTVSSSAPKGGQVCNFAMSTYCSPKINSLGCVPIISGSGTPSASASSGFLIECNDVINNKSGLLFYGVNGQAGGPFQGGTLCVAAPIKRTPGLFSGGNPPPNDCSGTFALDMNSFAQGLAGGNPLPALQVAGTVVNCQWWGRDPGYAAPDNTMLSNGLEFTICQ